MSRKILIRTGVFFVLVMFGVYWGFNFLKGKNIFRKQSIYYAIYNEVSNLKIGSTILYKGIGIGQIKTIRFDDNTCQRVVVEMYIDDKYKIPRGSVAEIYNADIMSNKGMRISTYYPSNDYYQPGDTFVSELKISIVDELSRQLAPIKGKSENVLVAIDSIIRVLHRLLVVNQTYLSTSLKSLDASLENIEAISNQLKNLLALPDGQLYLTIVELERLSKTLSENRAKINNLFTNLNNFSDTLAALNLKQTIDKTNLLLNDIQQIASKINNNSGTIGMLVNNDSLYKNLHRITNRLDSLTLQISKKPRKFIKFSIF